MGISGSLKKLAGVAFIAGCFAALPIKGFGDERLNNGAHFSMLPTVSDNELDVLRGRDEETNITVQSIQQLDAQVSNSSFQADTINSGAVTFGDSALQGFAGVGMFTIVTGNNNAVDSALGITFNLH